MCLRFRVTMKVWWCVVVLVLSWVSSVSFAEDVKLTVEGKASIATTDENFVCATLDWWPSDKCDYNQCPWGKSGILNLDLNNKILVNAVNAFNPLRIRLGGSLQDQVLYKVGAATQRCPHFKKKEDGLFGFSKGCLTMERWDEIHKFLNQTGAEFTFGLNALTGRRKRSANDTLYVGNWNSQNARDLMKYTVAKGYRVNSYELGNELCAGGVAARLEARQYGKDIIALKELVKALYPDANTQPKVLGPAGFYGQQWFKTFLEVSGPDVVDGVTHHIYNLGAGVDPTLIEKVQDPYFLDQVAETYKDVSTTIEQSGLSAGAWVGEAGGAYNSGGKDVSHTFANGFWYLDQLGMTAKFNHKVFCRQSLIGGNYGLLNTTTFIPNPDYYGALLWHRLMGKNVLSTTHSGSPFLRAYSHCSRTKPGITLMLINMSNSTTFEVSVIDDKKLHPNQRKLKGDHQVALQRQEYHFTPKDRNIQSDVVLLNGTPLLPTKSLGIPVMNPKLVESSTQIVVVPDSVVFATLRDFHAPACN